MEEERLDVVCIPSSFQAKNLIREAKLTLGAQEDFTVNERKKSKIIIYK